MAKVAEFKLRASPYSKAHPPPQIGPDEARRASVMADMCLEIAAEPTKLPAWAVAMTKEEHERLAQDLIDVLSRALDLYQCAYPGQDVCLDDHGRDRGWFDLKTEYGVVSVCVFCREVIYRDEAIVMNREARHTIFSRSLGELDRAPPTKISDAHRRRAEYHGLACACHVVSGQLRPRDGKALGLAVI